MPRRESNLSLVGPEAMAEAAVAAAVATPDLPLPTMPVLIRSTVFVAEMREKLGETQAELSIIQHQIEAEEERHQAALETERLKNEGVRAALEFQRDDLTNMVGRIQAALE